MFRVDGFPNLDLKRIARIGCFRNAAIGNQEIAAGYNCYTDRYREGNYPRNFEFMRPV